MPTPTLPPFDQAAADRRFLTEADRLIAAGAASSYRDMAAVLGIAAGKFSEIASGRYHINLALLYELARHYPQVDVPYLLFGIGRSTPAVAPERPRGRRPTGRPAQKKPLGRPRKQPNAEAPAPESAAS